MTLADSDPRSLGRFVGRPYRQAVEELWEGLGIWDYLRYNVEGQLWINDLRVVDAALRYRTPLEIVDTTIVERRAAEWQKLSQQVADQANYAGRLQYYYAAKANMASEIAHAAYRSGWNAETSSVQDLAHLKWLRANELLPQGTKVVCNGFKLPPEAYETSGRGSRDGPDGRGSRDGPDGQSVRGIAPTLPADTLSRALRNRTYSEQIVALAREGWDITPILDTGEAHYFAEAGTPPMRVGLRLRAGRVSSVEELDKLETRFGMSRHELAAAAQVVADAAHLELGVIHAMIGAAQAIPVPVYLDSVAACASVWASLRPHHELLTELNLGGGVPPLGDDYDHRGLLEGLFGRLADLCRARHVALPDITFEFGSLVAAEAGFHVLGIVQLKAARPDGPPWAIVDGGLMAAIPDMLIIGKPFRFLAASHADLPARLVRLGDLTCDPDGRYPPEASEEQAILLPDTEGPLHVVAQGVGAYQEILAGVRGAHHCGLLEAMELIVEQDGHGNRSARIMPRQTWRDAAAVLGYTEETVRHLAATMQGREPRNGSTDEAGQRDRTE